MEIFGVGGVDFEELVRFYFYLSPLGSQSSYHLVGAKDHIVRLNS